MPKLDFHKIEKKWQSYWEKEKVYRFHHNSRKPVYSIDTPPPTVSGGMHLGHAFGYAQQDFIARFKRMQGFNVFHPFGFDDNGLATDRFVEKKKNIKAKDFSREEYIKICLKETREEEKKMKVAWTKLGMSVDWSLLYRTIDDWARKTAQRSFIDIYEKGRAYQKEAPTMWCPKCETAIAQAELEDKELDSEFSDLFFETKKGKKVVISTTRPELLPACVAVFVHPEDKRYRNLVGKKLKVPLFDYFVPVIADHRVEPEKGSGVVMCCTFGDTVDIEWFLAHNLSLKIVISTDGRMNEKAKKYNGMKLADARKAILKDLKKAGKLGKQTKIKHTVNVHERCKTEIEFIVTKQWFVKYLDLKDEFIAKAEAIKWFPKHMKNRYDNWIAGLQWDWCISRQRHYGVPFPVWYCKECGKVKLANDSQLPVDPLKDKPVGKCECGCNEFEPEKDVFDTWFTSSLTPQINCKWRENPKFFKKMYPMDLRPQGHDIITLWAFNTIVKGLLHENQLPWNNIMINGWALDPKGKKMSKSLGNVIEPLQMIEKYSADILRYWAGLATLGEDVPFQEKEMVAGKKFLIKLFNASAFVKSTTKDFEFKNKESLSFRPTDKWILSRLNSLKKQVTEAMENYEFSKCLNPVRDFFWLEFADFYIEETKYRLYDDKNKTRKAAQFTLLSVLLDCLKMLAPFIPHTTEEIMQSNFKSYLKEKSIHLEKWPQTEEKRINEFYEEAGKLANSVITAIRKFKSSKSVPLNVEVKSVTIFLRDNSELKKLNEFEEDIRKTMNIVSLNVLIAKAPKEAVEVNKKISVLVEL